MAVVMVAHGRSALLCKVMTGLPSELSSQRPDLDKTHSIRMKTQTFLRTTLHHPPSPT